MHGTQHYPAKAAQLEPLSPYQMSKHNFNILISYWAYLGHSLELHVQNIQNPAQSICFLFSVIQNREFIFRDSQNSSVWKKTPEVIWSNPPFS